MLQCRFNSERLCFFSLFFASCYHHLSSGGEPSNDAMTQADLAAGAREWFAALNNVNGAMQNRTVSLSEPKDLTTIVRHFRMPISCRE